jgi:hypothetical protein
MGPSRLAVRVVVLALAAVGAGIVVACRQESPPPPSEPAPVVTASTAVAAPVPTPENTVALLLAAAPELTPQSARTLLDATSAAGQDATTLARVSLLEAMAGFARLTPDQLRELNGLFAKAYDHLASADRADVESYLQGVRGGRPGTTAAEARARRLLNGAILALSPSDRERLQALYGAAITASLAAKRETARRAAEPPPVVSAEAAPPFPPRSSAPAAATGRTAAASGASSSSSLDSAPTRGRGEAYWRNRAQQLRAAVARLERTVADLDAKATNLAYGAQSSRAMPGATAAEANAVQLLNAVAQQNWQAERTKVMGELERARRALASAKQELDNLDDEARRDGALPGWLR